MKKLIIFIAALTLVACASSVNVDYKNNVKFSQIKTFLVQAKPVNATTDTRIDSPFMQQRVIDAIGDNLVAKGLTVNKTNPDVVVKYHLLIKQEIVSDDTGVTIGFGSVTRHSFLGMAYTFPEREISSVDNLLVTIDMFDAKANLLWRGSLGRRLYDGSTPESNSRLVNSMVAEILKQFPPGQ